MKLLFRMFGFLVKPYWKLMIVVFLLSVFFVFFNSLALWISASFVSTLFSEPATEAVSASQGAIESTGGLQLTESSLNEYLKQKTNALFVRDSRTGTLKVLCWVIFLCFLLKSLCGFAKNVLLGFVEQRIVTDIRDRLFSHLQGLSLSFFQRRRLGEIVSIVINDVNILNSTLTTTFDKIIVTPINMIWLVTLLFIISWKVALFFLIIVPLNGLFIVKIGNSIRRKSRRSLRQISEVIVTLQEVLSNIKIVIAFATNLFEIDRFKAQTRLYFKLMMRQKILRSMSSPVSEILGAIIGVSILWYAGVQVLQHEMMTSEDFIRALVLMFSILQPLKGLSGINNTLQTGLAAGERIFDVLDTKPTVVEKEDAVDVKKLENGITIENASFRYSSDLSPVVNDVSFEVKRGNVLALVGPSGAGKSTIMNLIPRFYDVTDGAVKIDGRDVRDIKLASLRKLFGIVTQETILFNDSVRNNIAYGMKNVSKEMVEVAANAANADEFIADLENKYDTIIGERGVRLSGGQKQRIAIARAILQNPPVLLLDEATSSLDSESEQKVQKALAELIKNRTVLVIAHRLSTVVEADCIVVLNYGEVEAIGGHQELLKSSDLYSRLYEMQFGKGESLSSRTKMS
jgi:subfamily B ATP-binding cassette protein MsbA